MATTKIWPVRDSLKRVIDYASNPEKTSEADLASVIRYAMNGDKTAAEKLPVVHGKVKADIFHHLGTTLNDVIVLSKVISVPLTDNTGSFEPSATLAFNETIAPLLYVYTSPKSQSIYVGLPYL